MNVTYLHSNAAMSVTYLHSNIHIHVPYLHSNSQKSVANLRSTFLILAYSSSRCRRQSEGYRQLSQCRHFVS